MVSTYERLADRLRERLPSLSVERGAAVAPYTSFGIGGPADLLVVVESVDQLQQVVQMADAAGVTWTVLGSGTNVLVADEGICGLVIINAAQGFEIDEDGLLVAASGVMLCELARWAVAQGWRGLQWAVGIPGTLGGATVGNAGAYGGSMAEIVRWARVLRADGVVERVPVELLAYEYRMSALKREHARGLRTLVLETALQLERGDAVALAAEAASYNARRESNTPRGRCAGSMFKRTAHYPAGYLIDKAGMKGLSVGGAQVSPVHANFLMNVGGATASDMRCLIELVQQRIWRLYAHHLEPEIEFVGDWHWQPSCAEVNR